MTCHLSLVYHDPYVVEAQGSIQLLHSGSIYLHNNSVHEKVEMEDTFFTSIYKMKGFIECLKYSIDNSDQLPTKIGFNLFQLTWLLK